MPNQTIFLITFWVAIAVCIPLFLYIAKRNPNPRFRPRPGELLLLAILMVGASAVISFAFSSLFGVDDLVRGIDTGPPPTPRPEPDENAMGGIFGGQNSGEQ